MCPRISFDTSELTRQQAHALVDAAYVAGQPIPVDAGASTEDDWRDAKRLVELSSGRPWAALMGALERDGHARIGDVAVTAGYKPHGLTVALGRAIKDAGETYSTLPLSWSQGPAEGQTVSVTDGVRAAIRAERSGANTSRGA